MKNVENKALTKALNPLSHKHLAGGGGAKMPKNLFKLAMACAAFYGCLCPGQPAYSTDISTPLELQNKYIDANGDEQYYNYYDTNTRIIKDITLTSEGLPVFYGSKINIYGDNHTIDGGRQPETGYNFESGTTVFINNLVFNNFAHRRWGTIYIRTSEGILNYVTINGIADEKVKDHIWGSMVAIVDDSKGTIKNSTFQNLDLKAVSTAYDADGGALHIQGKQDKFAQSQAEILDSKFLNNHMTAGKNIYGAAIYNEGIITKLSGTKFEGNSVTSTATIAAGTAKDESQMLKTGGFGGALSLGSHNTGRGNATIELLENTEFINNTVTTADGYARGGALWSGDDSIIGEINNVTFSENKSITTNGIAYGGAIYSNGKLGPIINSTFENNSVISPDQKGVGGAIYSKNNLTIQDGTTFRGNTVEYLTDEGWETISNDIHVAQGADIIITNVDPTKKEVNILGGISSSQNVESELIVQNGAILNLSGKNDMFNGETTVKDNSTLNFTKTENFGTFVRGMVNINEGSTVNFNNELTGSTNDGIVTNLRGSGEFNKTGIGNVKIGNANNPDVKFTGNINLNGGSLTINAAPQTTKEEFDFTANIAAGTEFTYNSGKWIENVTNERFTLNNSTKLKFNEEDSGARLNFTGHGTFTVEDDITNGIGNTISFHNATISFDSKEYNGNYDINSSTVTLQDNKITNVIFNHSLTSDPDNARDYKIDFDFTDKGAFDTITAAEGDATLNLTQINALNTDKDLGQWAGNDPVHNTYTVLDGVTFVSDAGVNFESDIYKYTAQKQAGGNKLTIKATGLQANTLYVLNHQRGEGKERYFHFLGDTEYNVNQNLKGTLAGTLYVTGKSNNALDSIITGADQYSFFQNDNADSNLIIKNVTLQNAKGDGIAAVLDTTAASRASFENVVIQNNQTSGGKASAISNDGGTVSLKDVTFTNNTGAESYIYNSGTMDISTTSNRTLSNGASGNKITNEGTMNLSALNSSTYTVASAIDNKDTLNTKGNIILQGDISNNKLNILENSSVAISNNSGINGGEVDVKGSLLIKDNTSNTDITSDLKGSGTIIKSDNFITEIKGRNNDEFTGDININAGTLKFVNTPLNTFFNNANQITVDNAILDYTTDKVYTILNNDIHNVSLQNGGTFKLTGRSDGTSEITINDNLVNSDSSTNKIILNDANFTLNTNFSKLAGHDNIEINNSTVKFTVDDNAAGPTDYNMGNADWKLDKSGFRFLNKVAGDKYKFQNLTMKDSRISLDVNLTLDDETGEKPYADTFEATGGEGGIVEINRLYVTADNGLFDVVDGQQTKGPILVFVGDNNKLQVAKENKTQILSWATNVYKYGIQSAATNRVADSIEVIPLGASNTGTLRDLNRYELNEGGGHRGFSFIVKKDPVTGESVSNEYYIYRDLDTTSAQTFSVLGVVDEKLGKSKLDGTLTQVVTTAISSADKLTEHRDAVTGDVEYITYDGVDLHPDKDYTYENGVYTIKTSAFSGDQTQGSMFEFVNETDFLMSNITVQNAKRYSTDTIKDGSVIYANNDKAVINLENVDVKNNIAEGGNGGAIANHLSETFTIQDMKADGNSAGGLGGAIYTASDMNIINSDFGKNALNNDGTGANDIYVDGATLTFNTPIDKTNYIQSGIAGTGTFRKTGLGKLNLNGKNENFKGTLSIELGNVLYKKDEAADSFVRGDVKLESALEMAVDKDLTEAIQNVSGDAGTLTKTGLGTLNLNGSNSEFKGTVNLNEGSIVYKATDNTVSYFGGTTNIKKDAVLNYIADYTSQLNKVTGTGIVNYSGKEELTFNVTDNTGFSGTVNADGKQLNVTGNKTDAFYIKIKNGILNFTAADNSNLKLDDSSKISFANGTTGAQAIFNGGNSYTLGNITNVDNNTVTFKDTTVKVSQNAYDKGSYVLNNSTLNLTDNKTGEVSFENLSSVGGKLSIDADLNPLPDTPASDVLNVNNGNNGNESIYLTSINVLNEKNNGDNGLNAKYSFDVIKGNNNLTIDKDNSISKWATNVYEYGVDLNDSKKGIILTALKASDENSLKAINQYEGTRGFQFRDADDNPYTIGSDLGTTAKGIMTVNGTGSTVISGDGKYSFFDVQNKTDLTINDVTITNANKSNGSGSVINAVNRDASIVLNNVTLEGNKDANGKNDIYIAEGAKVSANNSAINSGLAGNGTFNADNSTLSGKNDNFTGTLNVTNGLTFSQTDAKDSYIKGTTNVGTSSVTLNIDKGNTTSGNFTGNGTLIKEGSKDIVITGNNSNFKGNVNINRGSISYNADNTKYFGGKTILAKDGGLKVSTNNGTELSKISGEGTLSKDGKGTLTLKGDNSDFNGNLNIKNGIFALAADASLGQIANGTFAQGTAINLQNTVAVKDNAGNWTTNPNPASIQNLSFDNLTLNGNVGLNIDVDLKNTKADTISANSVSGNGHLILGNGSLNVISDSLLKNTDVRIANGAVAQGNTIILSDAARTVMGPIQKYDVTYADGILGFARQGGSKPSINSVNPSVMASPVATQVGGYLTQLETLHSGFYHMDRYTKYSRMQRLAAEKANVNAIADTPQYNHSPLPETSQGMWVKPYTSFETVNLRGGLSVSTTTYGSLYGGDSNLIDLGHGYKGVISTFIGYNGSHQSYSGININQNGGTLGVTGTLYKGNFFTGITASAGASAGEASTYYGQDNFSMITAGIANKTGYNWELKDGKLIVQPSLFLGYTFVNTFDYRNAAGVRMDSDPLHAIQVIPGVKFIGNLENGWQPYLGVDMVWNIMDKTDVMANDVRLPQLSVKPYIQYGVGVQKSWGEKFTAFFQTMIRNGGRNGVSLSAGFRWAIGKKPVEKVKKETSKTVLKQNSKKQSL